MYNLPPVTAIPACIRAHTVRVKLDIDSADQAAHGVSPLYYPDSSGPSDTNVTPVPASGDINFAGIYGCIKVIFRLERDPTNVVFHFNGQQLINGDSEFSAPKLEGVGRRSFSTIYANDKSAWWCGGCPTDHPFTLYIYDGSQSIPYIIDPHYHNGGPPLLENIFDVAVTVILIAGLIVVLTPPWRRGFWRWFSWIIGRRVNTGPTAKE